MDSRALHTTSNSARQWSSPPVRERTVVKYTSLGPDDEFDRAMPPRPAHEAILDGGNVAESESQEYTGLIEGVKITTNQQVSKNSIIRIVQRGQNLESQINAVGYYRPWEAFWHRKSVLLSFILLFVLLIVSLGVLYHFSVAWNGFSTGISSNVYTWKYGPTAVLTALAILWQKVCYTSKVVAPWQSMSCAAGAYGFQTLLVDYITPILPTVIIGSFKNRHWAVLAAESGRLFLVVATGFSTGLLVLSTVTILDTGVPLHLNATFSSAGVSGQYSGAAAYSIDGTGAGRIGNLSFVDAVLRKYYGASQGVLPFSFGTTATMAYDTFIVDQSLYTGLQLTATLDTFIPDFQCQIPVIHNALPIQYFTGGDDPLLSLDIEVEGCVTTIDAPYYLNNLPNFEAQSRTIQGDWNVLSMQCSSGPVPVWIMAVTDGRYTQITSDQAALSLNYSASIVNISMAVCRPTYSITRLTSTIYPANLPDGTGVQSRGLQNDQTRMLDNFNNTNTLLAFESIINAGSDLTFAPLIPLANTSQNMYPAVYFSLLVDHNGNSSLEPFLDPQSMIESGQAVYQGVMAQFAHQFLTQPQSTTIQSQVYVQEERLLVKLSSLIVMATSFGLLTICTIVILINRATDILPRNPDNAVSQAAILTSSEDLLLALQGTGHLSDNRLNDLLALKKFRCTIIDDLKSPRLVVEPLHGLPVKEYLPTTEDHPYWQPFAGSWRFMALNFFVPTGVVILLEVLRRKSADALGICSISISSSVAHLLSTVVPAGIMILVSIMSQSADSAISILSPLAQLQSKASSHWRPTIDSPLAHIPLRNLFAGVRTMNLSLSFSSVTRFLAPFLTIFVAALYRITPYEIPSSGFVEATSYINSSWSDRVSDGTAGVSLGLIEQQGAAFPLFTFDELAFPEFKVSTSTQFDGTKNDSIIVLLPAVRASLDCVFIPPKNITVNSTSNLFLSCDGSCEVSISFQVNISASCANQLSSPFTMLPNDGVGAYMSGIWATFWNDRVNRWYADGCPTIGFYFGHARVNETTPSNMTAMMCWQNIEEVDATVTFLRPNMSIDPLRPPRVDESTRRTIRSEAQLLTATLIAENLPLWPIEPSQNSQPTRESLLYAKLGLKQIGLENGYSFNSSVESFFQTAILGQSGIDPQDLIGVENQSRFLNVTQHLYRRYMALLINDNMRETYTAGDQIPTYNATFYSDTGLRLIQNNTSKIALQAILTTMIGCSLLAYITLPIWSIRRSLPHNPCTIAGMMSFLAGPSICSRDITPVGAEFMTNRQLDRVFADRVFAMGWWLPATRGESLVAMKSRWRFDRAADKDDARFGIGIR